MLVIFYLDFEKPYLYSSVLFRKFAVVVESEKYII